MFNSSVLLNTEVTVELVCRGDGSEEVTCPPASLACSWDPGNLPVPLKRVSWQLWGMLTPKQDFWCIPSCLSSSCHFSPCSSCHGCSKSQGISWSCSCLDCGGPGSLVMVTSKDFGTLEEIKIGCFWIKH